MAVSVNQILANTLGLADPLGRIADDGRVGFNGRVNINGRPIRFAPDFDGVDDYGVLATRAINPDGDNTFEFFSVENSATIIAQNVSGTESSREFQLWQGGALELNITFGGSTTNLCSAAQGYIAGRRYFLTLTGTSFTLARDSQQNIIRSGTFTKGAAREPSAVTSIMCRSNGAGLFAAFARARQYNIRINGTLWRMADRNQAIQLPEPSGLGAELITPTVLENPAVKGSQWTYLGGGRWQLVGDGSLNGLEFITQGAQPNSAFLEFEIESISGSLACSYGSLPASIFTTIGLKRYFYTNKAGDVNTAIQFKRSGPGIVTSCIIKNISFKPLGTCNPMTLVNVTSDRWQEVAQ